jgi:hypothetical protein
MARIGRICGLAVLLASNGALYGCFASVPVRDVAASADVSIGSVTATISGSYGGMLNVLRCHPTRPAKVEEITVDAGWNELLVACYRRGGVVGESMEYRVSYIAFEAEPGHSYRLVGNANCPGCGPRSQLEFEFVEVIDETDGDRIILRTPLATRFDSTVDTWKTAIVMLMAPKNDFLCRGDPQGQTGYSKVYSRERGIFGGFLEPGTASFTVRCIRLNDPFGTRSGTKVEDAYTADITFEAAVSQIFVFDIDEQDPSCISVNEVSRGYEQLACERATRLDEWIGMKRDDLPEDEWGNL